MSSWRFGMNGGTHLRITIGGVLLLYIFLVLNGCDSSSPHLEGAPFHHTIDGFRNPPDSPEDNRGLGEIVSGYSDRIIEAITGYEPTLSPEYLLSPASVRNGLTKVEGMDALTWLGHASFLVNLGGKKILTDPFLTDYATGLPPFGPKRASPPALSIDELPQIDILVVSHNHYDHLDAETIEAMPGKTEIHVIVPLGMGSFFTERGYTLVTELDWYSFTEVDGVIVTAVPAIHNSGRGLFDRNVMLWAGYVFKSSTKQIYFSGDTGYGPVFSEISRKMGPVDYALVPIGVYEPRQRMKINHVNPSDAFKVAKDVNAKTIVAMHWGTIRLSEEAFEEPPQRFRSIVAENGYTMETAWVLKIGESRMLK